MTFLADRLGGVAVLYEIPDDDLVGEVLIPAMSSADEVRIGAGFFTSKCLAQIAPGLAAFLACTDAPLRLLMSPAVTKDDHQAIVEAVQTPQEVLERTLALLFEDARLSPARVVQHTVECLAYLVAAGRLELRVVLMQTGQYHKKTWLFRQDQDWLAVHGSGNATQHGLLLNGEQMSVDCTWRNESSSVNRIRRLIDGWDRQWENRSVHSLTVTAPQALRVLRDLGGETVPTVEAFWRAWRDDNAAGLAPVLPPNMLGPVCEMLRVPDALNWQTGKYAHQAEAVSAFEASGHRGILAIATGGGKTKASLVAATRLQNSHTGPTLLVVLVPSRPLAEQWADEVRAFGVHPTLPSTLLPEQRRVRLHEIRAALSVDIQSTQALIVTNQLFASDAGIRALVEQCGCRVQTVLIADEVHHLGVASFIEHPPSSFAARLGLSATPIRQYDPDGTDRLFTFFGGQIFEFGLAEAIKAGCLVPYDYYLHKVTLTHDEMELYVDLTDRLRRAGFTTDDGRVVVVDGLIQALLRARRSVLEHAGAKLGSLRSLLLASHPHTIQRTLIYASGKKPPTGVARQIEQVNALLNDLGVSFHQFTSAETARPDAQGLLDRFAAGEFQVLTAMKVLDEGVDLPQTDTAYLLASSTVQREWVQRRGRILRTAPGKPKATLHDFLVSPPDLDLREARLILRGELARANEFASLADNEFDPTGPRSIISACEDRVWRGGARADD